ncbi:hypothetical protein MOQ_005071 [Trypanosoma cruzi marinkellei]|uniref:Transmembrane protein n=1 Tax=Trypanosoma cruzi marinkellei TaxID=85056 RepID=K2N8N4_TRYCR|nr:hypothetical protein MOQ_005071 [Trypanosoma cruzi marinkellei]
MCEHGLGRTMQKKKGSHGTKKPQTNWMEVPFEHRAVHEEEEGVAARVGEKCKGFETHTYIRGLREIHIYTYVCMYIYLFILLVSVVSLFSLCVHFVPVVVPVVVVVVVIVKSTHSGKGSKQIQKFLLTFSFGAVVVGVVFICCEIHELVLVILSGGVPEHTHTHTHAGQDRARRRSTGQQCCVWMRSAVMCYLPNALQHPQGPLRSGDPHNPTHRVVSLSR